MISELLDVCRSAYAIAVRKGDQTNWEAFTSMLESVVEKKRSFPKIVCLCGSTKFWREFQKASLRETLAGHIVLSIGAAAKTDDEHFGNLPREEYDRVKQMLDNLHKRKIELADEVLILNVGGYIGPSTQDELEYARKLHKPVQFLEPEKEYSTTSDKVVIDIEKLRAFLRLEALNNVVVRRFIESVDSRHRNIKTDVTLLITTTVSILAKENQRLLKEVTRLTMNATFPSVEVIRNLFKGGDQENHQ